MFRVFSCIVSVFLFVTSYCQTTYTLQQCIDTALANNIPVKQKELQMQSAEVDWHQSKSNLLPNLAGNAYQGISQGKSIDPSSNNYVNQNLNYANYAVSSGVTLFNGGALQNSVKQYASAYEASKMDWQQAKDNLVLNVIAAYLQVLNNAELVTAAMNQAAVSQKALERAQVLDSKGAIKPSDVSDLKGQLMNDQLAVVTNQNALESSKLNLLQLMNKSYDKNMAVQKIDVSEFLTPYTNSANEVYQNALQQFSLIKAVDLRRKSFEYAAKTARGQLYPSLSLNGGLATNYSSVAQNLNGKIPYNQQLNNNLSGFVSVGLTIPIFNRSVARNHVKQADIALKNSELDEANTKILLQQQIDQAYLNMTNAFDRYKLLLEQVNAYTESFKAAEVRFNAGVGNSIDYLTAKDRLDRANINLISAKYDFVLRKKILDYYKGTQ